MNLTLALVLNLQDAFKAREAAKVAYHKSRDRDTAGAYSAALLAWDLAWSEVMNFRVDS